MNGQAGEARVSHFFAREFSRIISFSNPRTADGAEVADLLIWQNRVVFLVQVKTRTAGTAPIENWARNRIQDAVEQLSQGFERFRRQEQINLANDCYHLPLQFEGIHRVMGIVVLVHEENFSILPSDVQHDIYDRGFPIHVFSLNDLESITGEIDTIADLTYYLEDRSRYVPISDIPVGSELESVGYYKSHDYHFPDEAADFAETNFWNDYQDQFREQIRARDEANQAGSWVDRLAEIFCGPRRHHDGLPRGLYMAWECGSIPRTGRTVIGQQMDQVQNWFLDGNRSRQFAFMNPVTGNWWVIFYLRGSDLEVQDRLEQLMRLKLIQLVNDEQFQLTVFGFGFQISLVDPPQLLALAGTGFSADESVLGGDFTADEVDEAHRLWGGGNRGIDLQEFPD